AATRFAMGLEQSLQARRESALGADVGDTDLETVGEAHARLEHREEPGGAHLQRIRVVVVLHLARADEDRVFQDLFLAPFLYVREERHLDARAAVVENDERHVAATAAHRAA